jgi:hypothetical protein
MEMAASRTPNLDGGGFESVLVRDANDALNREKVSRLKRFWA